MSTKTADIGRAAELVYIVDRTQQFGTEWQLRVLGNLLPHTQSSLTSPRVPRSSRWHSPPWHLREATAACQQ